MNERLGALQNELSHAQGQLEAVQRERLSGRMVLQIVVALSVGAIVIIATVIVLLVAMSQ